MLAGWLAAELVAPPAVASAGLFLVIVDPPISILVPYSNTKRKLWLGLEGSADQGWITVANRARCDDNQSINQSAQSV